MYFESSLLHHNKVLKQILLKSAPNRLLPAYPRWTTHIYRYPKIIQVAVILISVNLTTVLYLVLNSSIGGNTGYFIYLNAVIVSAWVGGLRAGMYAVILSVGMGIYVRFLTGQDPLLTVPFIARSALFICEGMIISYVIHSMHSALTNYKLNNRALNRSEQKYRQVVECVVDYSIFTLNLEGYITSWNTGAEQTFGYSAHEIVGKHYALLFKKNEVNSKDPWHILYKVSIHGKYADEEQMVTRLNRMFWASVVISAIRDDEKHLYGYSVILRDTSEQRTQEKKKDEFISIASHELKTPVTSLKAFTQVLMRFYAREENKNPIKYLHKMDLQLDRLTLLVNDLLDVSRIQSGKIALRSETIDINELVHDTVEDLQELARSHELMVTGKVLHEVTADKDRINQVLINLLTNAIKYSPESSKVIVTLSQDGNRAVVGVKDYGIGVPSEYQNKIFERFFRVHDIDNNDFPGLGMGLYISSEIIKRHNGSVWVESKENDGSTFYFSLPL